LEEGAAGIVQYARRHNMEISVILSVFDEFSVYLNSMGLQYRISS